MRRRYTRSRLSSARLRRDRLITLGLGLALALLAIWEIGALAVAHRRAPRDDDWRAATAAVDSGFQDGELVTFAPPWVDPVGRQWLGHRLALDDAARMDAGRYAGIWEVTIRGAASDDVKGLGAPVSEQTFGAVRVRHFQRKAPTVTWDTRTRGSIYEVAFTPRKCVRLGAVREGGPPVKQTFAGATLGTELHVAAGLTDFRDRKENWSTARVAALVDGVEVAAARVGNDGWVHLPVATTTPGTHEVAFQATVDTVGEKTNLNVCVAAEARTP